jgi:hypothetical protein
MKKTTVKEESKQSAQSARPVTAIERVQRRVLSMPDLAHQLIIKSNEQYIQAAEMLRVIKGLRGEIDELLDPIIAAAHATHKEAVGQKKKVEGPLVDAEIVIKGKRVVWANEQERLRREEEQRQQREAEERENERRLAESTRLAEQGNVEEAIEVLEEEVDVPAVRVESYVPKVEGVSQRTTWYAEVTSLRELVKAVSEGRAPIECIEANMPFLNKQATAFRGGLDIAGVKARSKTSETVRG